MTDSVKGRAKGGAARAAALAPARRSEIAKKAAQKRWAPDVPKAEHTGDLRIGDLIIPCAVLPDGTRALSQRGVGAALGRRFGGQSWRRADDDGAGGLPFYVNVTALKPFIPNDLMVLLEQPILYRHGKGGGVARGLLANALPQVCNVWLNAREAHYRGEVQLNDSQLAVALRAEILMRGLAEVGIVALVDEATGYQKSRASDALAKILEAFIAKELRPWIQTFPGDFYEQMFRLRGLPFPSTSVKRPQYFGLLTNDIVYKRLAPGVLIELKRVTPKNDDGRPTAKLFQSLTDNVGYPKLKEHLGAVVALMRISNTWDQFINILNEHYPRYGDTLTLPMDYDQHKDDGKGL